MKRKTKNKTDSVTIIISLIIFIAVMYVMMMPNSPLDMVRIRTHCQDGRQVSIHVKDSAAENTAEFRKQGCVQVDGAGNLLKYDSDTGQTIHVDPVTGKQVEGQE